jgi:hypothetical protein
MEYAQTRNSGTAMVLDFDVQVRRHAHTSLVRSKREKAVFIRYLSNVSYWLVRKVRECVCGRAAHNRGDQISQPIRCLQNMNENNEHMNGQACRVPAFNSTTTLQNLIKFVMSLIPMKDTPNAQFLILFDR